jgi:hypothetical protein
MQRLAIFLIIIGIGSFVLPMMGAQFMLVSVFKDHETEAGVGMIVGGLVLLTLNHFLSDRA